MIRICQGCVIPMLTDNLLGTYSDGRLCTDYCNLCLNNGAFTVISSEEEMDLNILSENQKSIIFKNIVIEKSIEDWGNICLI